MIREICHDSLYSQALKKPGNPQFVFTVKPKIFLKNHNLGYLELIFSSPFLAVIKVDLI